jgi:hypothetical protein
MKGTKDEIVGFDGSNARATILKASLQHLK